MASPLAIAKLLVPQVPSLSYTAATHTLGLTPTSSKWDLRTAMTVQILRKIMTPGTSDAAPLEKLQARTMIDPGIKGKIWIAKATIGKPNDTEGDLRAAIFKAVDDMDTTGGNLSYTKPEYADIEVEWTGYRSGVGDRETLPNVSEEEKYKLLMAEPARTSETTILYVHGGAYFMADPITHRTLSAKLAEESKGRVCSVRYRLAPQAAFPGQLIDTLMVYLSLLYPPPGSMHTAVPADKIVVGGDSAGGNLSFALLQFLLQLHRTAPAGTTPTIRFHGREVAVPMPAGFSANSGWFDLSRALPSITANADFDYLPKPEGDDTVSRFPKSEIWPTDPPRGDLFCDLSLLDHPLVTLILARDWSGAPPLWMCTGQECLTDEDLVVAARAAKQGVTVHFERYEAMPHCFAMLMTFLPTAQRCLRSWGAWCRGVAEEPAKLVTNGVYVHAKTGKDEVVQVADVATVSDEEVVRLVAEAKERRVKGWDKEGMGLPKPAAL